MDSDKIIQSKILELVFEQYGRFYTQKSPDKHLGVEVILEKLKAIYPDIDLTIVNTQCFRLSAKGFIEPIHTIEYINCTITVLGQNAYRSQLLQQENSYEETVNKQMKSSIEASEATKRLATNQIEFNNNSKDVTFLVTCLLVMQTIFFIAQWVEMNSQTRLLQSQVRRTLQEHKDKQSADILHDTLSEGSLNSTDTTSE